MLEDLFELPDNRLQRRTGAEDGDVAASTDLIVVPMSRVTVTRSGLSAPMTSAASRPTFCGIDVNSADQLESLARDDLLRDAGANRAETDKNRNA